MKVGFIGLGNMGRRMALNLMHDGHKLVVCDASAAALASFVDKSRDGIEVATTPAAVAATPEVQTVITMLPSSSSVEEVYCGHQGILSAKDTGGIQPSLLIDSSTIEPMAARRVASAVSKAPLARSSQPHAGCRLGSPVIVDAPVSGGTTGASAATLTFMCGGDDAAITAAEPLLLTMGKRVLRCGASGSGQAAKVCNNLALAIEMAGVSEALALGARLGLDPRTLSMVFNSSSARCWSSDAYNPVPGVMADVPASRAYRDGFTCALMLKDLGLAEASAGELGSPMPMGQQVKNLYESLAAVDPTLDFSGIYAHVFGGKGC